MSAAPMGAAARTASTGINRRTACAGLLSIALTTPGRGARAQTTEPPFKIFDFDWQDRHRGRAVPARLYWPGNRQRDVAVPLVVFSHGIGGSRLGYSYLGRRWSSRGVASLHVQHVGSDATLWRGNPLGLVGRLQAAAQESEALARAADVRFALDRMLDADADGLGASLDRGRLIAAGHSYGANTTLLSVGAQVVRDGRTISCLDERFSAAVVISSPPFYGEADLPAVLRPVGVPTLHVTATDDVIEIPGYRSPAADRLAVFDAVGDPRKLLAVFQGGSHSMFTDRAMTGGMALNPKVKAATADLALAFLDLTYDGDASGLTRWRDDWSPILARPIRTEAF